MMMLFMVAAPGYSQDQDQSVMRRSGQGACMIDIQEFCKGIKRGGGRIWTCLKSNEDRLSQGCKDYIAQVREKRKDFHNACETDINKFCKEILPGKGRIVSCLKSHERELSETCRNIFQK
jgi:hypothetical protein